MADVTAFTAARSQAIEDAGIASAAVDGNGDLILTRNDASIINAGSVIGPSGPQGLTGEVSNADLAVLFSALGLLGKKIQYRTDTLNAAVGNGAGGSPFLIDLPLPYANANYAVVASLYLEVKGSYSYFLMVAGKTFDSFKVYVSRTGGANLVQDEQVGITWIAIGDE